MDPVIFDSRPFYISLGLISLVWGLLLDDPLLLSLGSLMLALLWFQHTLSR